MISVVDRGGVVIMLSVLIYGVVYGLGDRVPWMICARNEPVAGVVLWTGMLEDVS